MELIKYPNSILTTVSKEVSFQDEEVGTFVVEFNNFIKNNKFWGTFLGLAAPQVGKNYRIFYAMNNLFINPVMTIDPIQGYFDSKEGCYSLEEGKFDYPTRRAYQVKLEWRTIDGEFHKKKFRGEEAQIIQHEMEHLDGKLCCMAVESK